MIFYTRIAKERHRHVALLDGSWLYLYYHTTDGKLPLHDNYSHVSWQVMNKDHKPTHLKGVARTDQAAAENATRARLLSQAPTHVQRGQLGGNPYIDFLTRHTAPNMTRVNFFIRDLVHEHTELRKVAELAEQNAKLTAKVESLEAQLRLLTHHRTPRIPLQERIEQADADLREKVLARQAQRREAEKIMGALTSPYVRESLEHDATT